MSNMEGKISATKGAVKGIEVPCFMWPYGENKKVYSAEKTKEI